MYEPFQFDQLLKKQNWLESFNLDLDRPDPVTAIFTEAYFSGGKETIAPVVTAFDNLKTLLDTSIKMEKSKFDARKFVKSLKFKELEDALTKVFGFRNIEVLCSNAGYSPSKGTFTDEELNCYTWPTWRYTIDGLVTDKGFYDSTHSINTQVAFTLGLLHKLSAEECVAVLLHEIGHNLDPALVDINYTVTNVFSKYLTERDDKITDREKKAVEKGKFNFIGVLILVGCFTLSVLVSMIAHFFEVTFFNADKAIASIKEKLKKDGRFSRVTNQEAFADNFARMYGFGAHLMSAMNKIDKFFAKELRSAIKKEKERQWAISNLVQGSIEDVHKTDIHRIHSLIREYEVDLKDPDIPSEVKKSIREDLNELQKVLESYLKDRSAFANRVNQLIADELKAADVKFEKKAAKADEDKNSNSSEAKPVSEATLVDDNILSTTFTENGDKSRNFILPERLKSMLPFQVERLAKFDRPSAQKLLWGNKTAKTVEDKPPYDEKLYYCDPPSQKIPYRDWDVIDVTELYAKMAEAVPACVKIDTRDPLPINADPLPLLTKSHCLGTGIRLTDDENVYCFMQIMTADLPDPNIFGEGIKIAQIITGFDNDYYGESYDFITAKTIPGNPQAYRPYGEADNCRVTRKIRAAELTFEPNCHSYVDLWSFMDILTGGKQTIDVDGKSIDFAEISKIPYSSSNKAWICKKSVMDSFVVHSNIGGYTCKCQEFNEPCLLGVACELTWGIGESIGDCGSIWVDLKGKCDWDCY